MKKVFIVLSVILFALIAVVVMLIFQKENGSETNIGISLTELNKLEPLNGEFQLMKTKKLIVLFSPSCDLCEEEFNLLEKNYNKISDIQLILISPYNRTQVKDFVKKFNLGQSNNTDVLIGDYTFLNKIFGIYSFPTSFVVDTNGKVYRKFKGGVSFDAIYRQLKKCN